MITSSEAHVSCCEHYRQFFFREAEEATRAEYEARLQKETEERAKLAEEVKVRKAADERREAKDKAKKSKVKSIVYFYCLLYSNDIIMNLIPASSR